MPYKKAKFNKKAKSNKKIINESKSDSDSSSGDMIIDYQFEKIQIDPNKFEEYDYEWEDLQTANNDSTCLFCDEKVNNDKELQICFECGKKLLITQTNALKIYGLKKEHLKNLEFIEYKNRNAFGYTYLYLLKDIRTTAIEIHFDLKYLSKSEYASYSQMILDKRINKDKINKIRKNKLKQTKILQEKIYREECNKRMQRLKLALKKYDLKIRSDSVYCNLYIAGNKITLLEVVDMVITMDFLYKNTIYPKLLDKLYDKIKKENDQTAEIFREMRERYTKDDFRHITEKERETLKYEAIKKYILINGIMNLPEPIFFKYENHLTKWLIEKKQNNNMKIYDVMTL